MKKFYVLIAAMVCAASMSFAQVGPIWPNRDGYSYLHYDNGEFLESLTIDMWGVVFQAGAFDRLLQRVKIYTKAASEYEEGEILRMFIYAGTNSPNEGWYEKYHQDIVPRDVADWQLISLETPLSFAEGESCWILLYYSGTPTGVAPVTENSGFIGVNWKRLDNGTWDNVDDRAFMIRADFDDKMTIWTTIPYDAIWSENFESNYAQNTLPAGWTVANPNRTNWEWGTGDDNKEGYSPGAYSGTYNLKKTHSQRYENDTLISPVIDLGTGYKDVKLGFWLINREWGRDVDFMTVYFRTSEQDAWHFLKKYEHYRNEWTWNYEIPMGYQEGPIQFAFDVYDDYGHGVAIDDIYITGTLLPEPTDAEPEGEQLTVYIDITSNTSVPYDGYNADGYTRSQYVIPAADLTNLKDMNIHAVRWYSSNNLTNFPMYGDARFDVYLKEVNYTAISAFETKEDNDILYHGEIAPSRTTDGRVRVTIEFDKPFTYHGGNLLIGCDNTVRGKYLNTHFYGQTVENAAISDYSSQSLDNVTSPTQQNFIPMTTFYYTAPETGIEEVVEGQKTRERCAQSQKMLIDGQLFILRGEHIFNAQGARVK